MKIKVVFIVIILMTAQKATAQNDYIQKLSKLSQEFDKSRFNYDYQGVIINGEQLKSIFILQNDSIRLLAINSYLAIAYKELRSYDKLKNIYKEIENYKFVYEDTFSLKNYFSILCIITGGLIEVHDLQQAKLVQEKCERIYNQKTFEQQLYHDLINNKINIYYEIGNAEKAVELTKETISKTKNINLIFTMYMNLISHYFDYNKLSDAEASVFEVLKIYNRQDSLYKKENSLDPNYKHIFLDEYKAILFQLSRLYELKFDYNNMLATDEKILQMSKDYSLSPRYLTMFMMNLAESYAEHNKLTRAIELCNEAVEIIEKSYGNDSPELISIFNGYGLLLEEHNTNEALSLYLKACKISEKLKEYYPEIESPYKNVSRIYSWPKLSHINLDSSLSYLRKAFKVVEKYYSESSDNFISTISDLAISFSSSNNYDSSLYYHLLAKRLYEKYNKQESYLYNVEILYLAIDYVSISKKKEAIFYFNQWISYWRLYLKNNFLSLINDIDKGDKIRREFELYDSYAQRINDQQMFKISFENKIVLKNLQLNQYSELKREIKKNKEAQDVFKKINLLSSSEANQRELFNLKTILYNTLPIFSYIENSFSISLDDCKRKLNDGDALIEFGKYNYIYSDDGQESDFYFALILRKDKNDISYVPLGFETDLNKF